MDFARFVQADKRMRFWTKGAWISHPERFAQDLLHTALKAQFKERLLIFEELAAGAGRLDMLLQLGGGMSAIVELKMCGHRYSSAYAASGEDQIRHYMQNRSVHL